MASDVKNTLTTFQVERKTLFGFLKSVGVGGAF